MQLVTCRFAAQDNPSLTRGALYPLISQSPTHYIIVDNLGQRRMFKRQFFTPPFEGQWLDHKDYADEEQKPEPPEKFEQINFNNFLKEFYEGELYNEK